MIVQRVINAEADKRRLTDGLSDGHGTTQCTHDESILFPRSVSLLADPKHLNHEEGPLEEDDDSDDQHNLFLGGPGSNAHNSEDYGEARSPDGTVEACGDCDRSVSQAE
jgi:hypothetical protein